MKLMISIVLILVNNLCYSQSEKSLCIPRLDSLSNIQYYPTPDKFPKVEGGDAVLFDQLNNLVYPPMEKPPPISTKIWVAFIVDVDGSVKGKRILRDIDGFDFGQQVLSILDKVTWIPGECNGCKVACKYMFPVILEFR